MPFGNVLANRGSPHDGLLDAITRKGSEIGVKLVPFAGAASALHFDYGFKVRPFFPRLVEPVAQRLVWLDEQGIDVQIVGKTASPRHPSLGPA
jgi:hypothetical protein